MRAFAIAVLSLLLLLPACSSCDDDGGSGSGGSIAGVATKGIASHADFTIRELHDTGAPNRFRASGRTDEDGRFAADLGGYRGWVVVAVTGGSYVDEASGTTRSIPTDQPLLGYALAEGGATTQVSVTPLSTIGYLLFSPLGNDPNVDTARVAANATRIVERHFGVSDITTLVPADLTSGPVDAGPAADYGMALAAISQLASTLGLDPMVLTHRLGDDFKDYVSDGQRSGTAIPGLTADAGTQGLADALDAFLAGPRNRSGLTAADTMVDDTLRGNTTGALARPIEVLAGEGLYGDRIAARTASVRAAYLPSTASDLEVAAGGVILAASLPSADQVDITVPATLPVGEHDLRLTDLATGLSTDLRSALRVGDLAARPVVDQLWPPSGPVAGGTKVELRGPNLGPDTEVRFGGTPAAVAYVRAPNLLQVYAPPSPGATGTQVDVTVANGGNTTVLQNAFRYRTDDVRSSAPMPSTTAATRVAAFRVFNDPASGLTATVQQIDIEWFNADQGSFSTTELSASASMPAPVTSTRTGTSTRVVTPLLWTVRNVDTGDRTEYYDLAVEERRLLRAGTTANGFAFAWDRPSGVGRGTLDGDYWASGWVVRPADGTIEQVAGRLEFRTDERGSANLQTLSGTVFDDVRFGFGYLQNPDGTWVGTLSDDASQPTQFDGAFDREARLGWARMRGQDGAICFYTLARVDFGGGNDAFGSWTGGLIDGSFSAQYSPLGFGRGQFLVTSGSATAITVDPTGLARDEDGMRRGYFAPLMSWGLALGAFPGVDGAGSDAGDPQTGLLRACFDRFTSRSMASNYLAVEQSYAWTGVAGNENDPVSTGALSESSLVETTVDGGSPPRVLDAPFAYAGRVPSAEAATATGRLKTVTRDPGSGAASTTLGTPSSLQAEVGVTFVDDRAHLFATRALDAGSPIAGASFPLPLYAGRLAADAEVFFGRAASGSRMLVLVERSIPPRPVPTQPREWGGAGWEFSNGSTPPATLRLFAHRGTYSPPASGSPFSFAFSWSLSADDGTSQLLGQAGSGSAAITTDNLFEVRFPDPVATSTELVYVGISSPADDFSILLDFTPSSPRAGVLCMTRPNFTSSVPLSRNYYEASQELGFFDTSTSPAVAFASAGDVAFAPPGPPYNYKGRSARAYNHPVAAPSTVREYADTLASLVGPSLVRATFVGTLDSFDLFVSDRGRTFGFINLSSLRDLPRLFVGSWD